MPIEITSRFEGDRDNFLRFTSHVPRTAIHLVRDAIDDIGDRIEETARAEAPLGDTGELKAHPVDRSELTVGAVTGLAAFGGGRSIRGEGGRFVGAAPVADVGRVVARQTITLPEIPRHAVWVHDGTGIYGPIDRRIVPRVSKFLVFHSLGRKWVFPSVRGQRPNPYLERAFVIIDRTYIPARVERLRLEIRAIT